ncbi:NAD(P)/FAD-dependent oxidoreductase [Saccharothrix syringae]|uniref:FAD-dependent oxidoreductase n=1 Tax=Saccharothrix syringae TaxID=103733 RepID=A0A5Q0H5H6_SACSY|nr:FAD-dependent oxidoreductase [Saccharothrix syringae]QFZ21446.1 FAD-dependent oxidoreductase [Saccharothrix syringae]
MATTTRLVVVGASLAGLRAVESARAAGFTGSITLLGAEPHPPYDRPELSKTFLTTPGAAPRFYRDPAELGARWLGGRRATALDPDRKVVVVDDGDEIPYDAMVIATGARARTLPGAEGMAGVHVLRGLDDALALRRDLAAARRTVVVGAGFIGSEVAASARALGSAVTVVEAAPTPLARAFGPALGELCARLHTRNGTDLRCGVSVTGFEGDGRVSRVLLSDGTALDADVVVVGIGAEPAADWLVGSGLRLDDGVVCDRALATGADGVHAAGDVVRWHNPLFDRDMRLEHWTGAAEQGAVAGRNAVTPGPSEPCEVVPYLWSDWYGARIQFAGVPGADGVRVFGDPDGRGFVALHRDGDRLAGVLGVNRRADVTRFRARIRQRVGWSEAVEALSGSGLAAVG